MAEEDSVFKRYSAYYDLLYRDKDYAAEALYVARTLRGALPKVRTVLELGCGTGRHGLLLASRGLEVCGVDASESMLALAHQNMQKNQTASSGSFDCIQGDIRTLCLNRTFDAVIALFHVVSYQTSSRDLLCTFAATARHLRRGGIFFFDVWHGPAVLHQGPSVRIKRVEDESTCLTRIAEPELDTDSNTVNVQYTMVAESKCTGRLTTFHERHCMRYLFPTEIACMAEQAGFEVVRSEESLTGKAPSERTWNVVHLLRKSR